MYNKVKMFFFFHKALWVVFKTFTSDTFQKYKTLKVLYINTDQ